ncbi:hypothetical protein E2493_05840 [Sphingomonas parva]|uniref:Uncharacterized protein n=1 Tax=Sphingomonas parva TaxID=2555898 RepID=A0A4Y8ZV51_9SPHN|nr:hypothetical protein E2493_05840 [Sphingomonas parva]
MMRTGSSICALKQRFAEVQLGAAVRCRGPLRPFRCDRRRRLHLTSRAKGRRIPPPTEPSR